MVGIKSITKYKKQEIIDMLLKLQEEAATGEEQPAGDIAAPDTDTESKKKDFEEEQQEELFNPIKAQKRYSKKEYNEDLYERITKILKTANTNAVMTENTKTRKKKAWRNM